MVPSVSHFNGDGEEMEGEEILTTPECRQATAHSISCSFQLTNGLQSHCSRYITYLHTEHHNNFARPRVLSHMLAVNRRTHITKDQR